MSKRNEAPHSGLLSKLLCTLYALIVCVTAPATDYPETPLEWLEQHTSLLSPQLAPSKIYDSRRSNVLHNNGWPK
jgi:hypothetical protein